jgi:hypothetical protein
VLRHIPFGVVGAGVSYCVGGRLGRSMSADPVLVSSADAEPALGCCPGAGDEVARAGGDVLAALGSILAPG